MIEFEFDFDKNEFILENGSPVMLSGVDALRIWIEKCLRSHNGSALYPNFGCNIDDLIGTPFNSAFAQAEIKREIEEALLKNHEILSVSDFKISKLAGSLCCVEFCVNTIYGKENFNHEY